MSIEYRVIPVADLHAAAGPQRFQSELQRLGNEGWQLVQVVGGLAVFVRAPKPA